MKDGQVTESEPRPLVEDLDSLPYPYRPFEPEQMGGFPTLPLLASRGCARRCSFCSIHTFYRTAPGKVVRVRKPVKVVEEMLYLFQYHCIRVILQDDDFPLWGRRLRGAGRTSWWRAGKPWWCHAINVSGFTMLSADLQPRPKPREPHPTKGIGRRHLCLPFLIAALEDENLMA